MKRFKFVCPSKHTVKTTWRSWLPFAKIVTAHLDNLPFPLKGILSKNSVMVVPVRYINGKPYIGILKEKRPLFCGDMWLAAFPAGKIEEGQSPADAARLESLQEGGIVIKNLKLIGVDMPFLHIISEKVYLFTAELDREGKQSLEAGEWISNRLTWISYTEFKKKIRRQQRTGIPILKDAPMWGVSLSSANKLIVLDEI